MTYALFVQFQNHDDEPYWTYSGMTSSEQTVTEFVRSAEEDMEATKNMPYKTVGNKVVELSNA